MNSQKVVRISNPQVAPGAIMTRFGDADAITNGGGVVFLTNNGPFLEYTEGDADGGGTLEVYRTHLPDDVCDLYGPLQEDLAELCETIDTTVTKWRARARHKNPAVRAECVLDIANYYGWELLDDDPLEIEELSLQIRWHSEFHEEGVCAIGESPSGVVPDLLQTLKNLDFDKYLSLSQPFPIVPDDVLLNPEHPWWQLHGQDVLLRVTTCLETACPEGFALEFRDGAFGFWRTSA